LLRFCRYYKLKLLNNCIRKAKRYRGIIMNDKIIDLFCDLTATEIYQILAEQVNSLTAKYRFGRVFSSGYFDTALSIDKSAKTVTIKNWKSLQEIAIAYEHGVSLKLPGSKSRRIKVKQNPYNSLICYGLILRELKIKNDSPAIPAIESKLSALWEKAEADVNNPNSILAQLLKQKYNLSQEQLTEAPGSFGDYSRSRSNSLVSIGSEDGSSTDASHEALTNPWVTTSNSSRSRTNSVVSIDINFIDEVLNEVPSSTLYVVDFYSDSDLAEQKNATLVNIDLTAETVNNDTSSLHETMNLPANSITPSTQPSALVSSTLNLTDFYAGLNNHQNSIRQQIYFLQKVSALNLEDLINLAKDMQSVQLDKSVHLGKAEFEVLKQTFAILRQESGDLKCFFNQGNTTAWQDIFAKLKEEIRKKLAETSPEKINGKYLLAETTYKEIYEIMRHRTGRFFTSSCLLTGANLGLFKQTFGLKPAQFIMQPIDNSEADTNPIVLLGRANLRR
jgi:hypothetical protein